MDKSYVTMVQRICVDCGENYCTNELMLDARLKDTFEKYTVVGFGLCDKCLEEAKKKGGLWAYSTVEEGKTTRLNDCVCFHEDVLRQLFNDLPETPRQCIQVDATVLSHLLAQINKACADAESAA